MGIYYSAVEGDPLDSGGNSRVIEGASNFTIEGEDGRSRGQAYIGHKAYCDACKSVGPIVAARVRRTRCACMIWNVGRSKR